jgi:hypothetical protein
MQYKNIVTKCMFLLVIKGQDFKIVVMLQNCMGLMKDEPDSGSEACAPCWCPECGTFVA